MAQKQGTFAPPVAACFMVLHSNDQICNILHLSSIICVGKQAYLLDKKSHFLGCKLGLVLKSKFNQHSNVQEHITQFEK